MTDDLVKRLREYRVGCGLHCEAHDAQEPLSECIEAASRIEKLEAALRVLSDGWECCFVSQAMKCVAHKALEEKDGV